jgi:hypothetical protein
MRIRTIAAASALTAAGVFAFAGPASAAKVTPNTCFATYMTPVFVNNQFVEVSGELWCQSVNDPRDGAPLTVILQESTNGSSWTTVATGVGDASKGCSGTLNRYYRLYERSNVVVQLPCV